jgi:hypothetical protein
MLRRIRSIPGSKGCTGVQKAEENKEHITGALRFT